MDWQALGSVGELLGAVGVIFSLIYLGTQIRASTRQSRSDAIYNLQKAQSDVMEAFCTQPELAKLMAKLERSEPLEPHEAVQMDFVVARITGIYAALQAAADNGIVDDRYLKDSSVTIGIFARRFRISESMWRYVNRAHDSVKTGLAFQVVRELAGVAAAPPESPQ